MLSTRSTKAPDADRDEVGKKTEILAISPFGRLPRASREALLALGSIAKLNRRHRISQQGEPAKNVALIAAGRVRIERISGLRMVPLGHRGRGELVGETALSGAGVASESAVVVDETEVLLLPVAGVRKLIASDEAIRSAAVMAVADRFATTRRRLSALLLHGVEARLVDFLRDTLSRWGEPVPGGERISAPFTHAEIALLVGSTRETVTLLLGKLKREKLIDLDKRRIVVPDRGALDRFLAGS